MPPSSTNAAELSSRKTAKQQGARRKESAEVKRLKRENAELKRANGILKAASAFFAAELDRPSR